MKRRKYEVQGKEGERPTKGKTGGREQPWSQTPGSHWGGSQRVESDVGPRLSTLRRLLSV